MLPEKFTIDHFGFCNRWHASQARPFVEWDELKAREAHENLKPYSVLFYACQDQTPFAAAELRGGTGDQFIDVTFLDEAANVVVIYYYSSEYEGDRLFLRSAMCFGGQRSSKDRSSHTWRLRHVFEPSAAATTFFFEEGSGTKNISWEVETKQQWIDFPDFGHFDRLAELNFGQPWDPFDRHGL